MGKNIHSFKAATTLTARKIVYVSAANTVAYLNTVTSLPIGITTDTMSDTTVGCPVACVGEIAWVEVGDSFAAGARITGSDAGLAVAYSVAATSTAYVGIALEAKSGAGITATFARCLIQPSYDNKN